MKNAHQDEKDILRDIANGKYRGCYLIYNRKSTDDTANQKNSIKYQKAENARFAARQNFLIATLTLEGFATDGIVSERHSGFEEDLELTFGDDNTVQYRVERPKFHRLVQWLSGGYFKGVVILCWDRASRNKADDTILRKLMKSGVDIRFTLAQYDKTSSGALHMDIDGMFAEHHSRVTSEKVTMAKHSLREQGVCTYRAPVGYLNRGDMLNKLLDQERAPIIRQLFEKAATGCWSLADLARWAIEQGFTMPPMRRRRTEEEILAEEDDDVRLEIKPISRVPTFTSIHKILTNPFYAGKIVGNDGALVHSTSHEALISEELFNRVQAKLRSKRRSAHYIEHLDFPLRRLMRCAVCHRVYTPYLKKGIVYYGARCTSDCTNPLKNFNFDFIAAKIGALIAPLSFTEEERANINARALTDLAILEARHLQQFEASNGRRKRVLEDLGYLRDNRLVLLRTGAYTAESYVEEERRLTLEFDALKSEEDTSGVAVDETVKDIITLSELLETASVTYFLAKPHEKERIIRVIFSELTLSGNSLNYKCTTGVQPLASRLLPSHDPIGWLSELYHLRREIAAAICELGKLVPDAANDNDKSDGLTKTA